MAYDNNKLLRFVSKRRQSGNSIFGKIQLQAMLRYNPKLLDQLMTLVNGLPLNENNLNQLHVLEKLINSLNFDKSVMNEIQRARLS